MGAATRMRSRGGLGGLELEQAARAAPLQSLLAANQGVQALVLLTAGGAAIEMRAQTGDRRVCVLASELQFDVAVELVEADIAADLRPDGAQEAAECLLQVGSLHQCSSKSASMDRPRSARCVRNLRRASCRVLYSAPGDEFIRSASTSIGTPFRARA